MQLPEEKLALRETAAAFLADACPLEVARRHDEAGTFPRDLYERLGDLGWQGILFPAEYGGSDGDMIDVTIVLEQLGRAMGPLASAYLISVMTCGLALWDLGTPAQIDHWLRPVIAGRSILALALTEPGAGSDAAALTTRAAKTADGWRLSGQKMFCTGAPQADALLVAAKTAPGPAKSSVSIFIVDVHAAGLQIDPVPMLGLHPYPSCGLFFDDIELPEDALLGEVNTAWRHLTTSLNRERLGVAAMCTGMAQAALDFAVPYIQARRQFGVPVSSFPAVRHHIARMASLIDSARLLTYRAAELEAAGRSSTRAASMAKIRTTDAAVEAGRLGMRVMGGYGYTAEYPMQRFLRDALIHPIAGGSNEIQHNIVAHALRTVGD
jgi:alkylation response protein AidB-like acyl-CoA dehydrogenase